MSALLATLCAVAVLVVVFTFAGMVLKRIMFARRTPDGDSLGNRLMGHGPTDEVYYTPWYRDAWRALRRRREGGS